MLLGDYRSLIYLTMNAEEMLKIALEVCNEHLGDLAQEDKRQEIRLVRASIIAAAKARGVETQPASATRESSI
jgi:hypothetical protein